MAIKFYHADKFMKNVFWVVKYKFLIRHTVVGNSPVPSMYLSSYTVVQLWHDLISGGYDHCTVIVVISVFKTVNIWSMCPFLLQIGQHYYFEMMWHKKNLKCTHCGIFYLIPQGYDWCTVIVAISVLRSIIIWSIGISDCSSMHTKHNIRFSIISIEINVIINGNAPALFGYDHTEGWQIFSCAWGADSTYFEMWNKKSQMYTPWDILSNIWELQRVHCCCCYFYLRNRYCLIHWN